MLNNNCITSLVPPKSENLLVAYSGGVDSHVLLHLIAQIKDIKPKITAVYIHHGLQEEADDWAIHCAAVASNLNVKFKCIRVNINETSGKSLEELARDARYQALKGILKKNDVVLLAQHREDQMETVLLQLFRGAGVQGLSGMPETIAFGKGLMCRPFIDISKKEINQYAVMHELSWVEDPSNKTDRFDRNFLRNQVLPILKEKWPSLDKTVSRSARHCANTQQLTESIALELSSQLIDEEVLTLNVTKLRVLDKNKQHLVIRQWFKVNNLRMPSEKIILVIINEVSNALESKNPEIVGKGYRIKRYREKLFFLKEVLNETQIKNQLWPQGSKQITLEDGATLTISEATQGIPKILWDKAEVTIQFRKGAEKIKLPRRDGRHSLKKLYQEKAIPPWQRSSIPLIYLDNNLASIANIWISADFYLSENETCYKIDWQKP